MEISIPPLLEIPEKLLPIITEVDNYRYFLLEGGRGSGKSQAIARFILYLCSKLKVRVVCGREIQNSIEESVYTIFSDLINQHNLFFEIMATKITHRETGSEIKFRGFREQGAINIKGLEGVDILWVDEAQGITKQTLDVIIPTIRKDTAKVFWSMNRWVSSDPVFHAFYGRSDCLHININYFDNKFCPQALIREAEECKKNSEVDYSHIWLGIPLEKNDNGLLSQKSLDESVSLQVYNKLGIPRKIMAIDVARFGNDETVYSIIECYGARMWEQSFQLCRSKDNTMETVGRAISLSQEHDIDIIVVDEGGIGGGVVDRLNELQKPVVAFDGARKPKVTERYYNSRAEGYFELKELFEGARLKVINDPLLLEQLISISFKFNSNGTRQIISKDEMRKQGLKSPDRADALMMAVSQIDAVLDRTHDNEPGRVKFPRSYSMDTDIEHGTLPRYSSMA